MLWFQTPEPCEHNRKVNSTEGFPLISLEFAPSNLSGMFWRLLEPSRKLEFLHVAAYFLQNVLAKDTGFFPRGIFIDEPAVFVYYTVCKSLETA